MKYKCRKIFFIHFKFCLSPYPLGKTPLNISVPKGLSLPPPGWVSTESYPRISDGQSKTTVIMEMTMIAWRYSAKTECLPFVFPAVYESQLDCVLVYTVPISHTACLSYTADLSGLIYKHIVHFSPQFSEFYS